MYSLDVTNDMKLAREEIFGPIAPMIRAHGDDDALRIANETEYGLAGSVFTRDLERGARSRSVLRWNGACQRSTGAGSGELSLRRREEFRYRTVQREWAIEAFTTDQWLTIQHVSHHYPQDARSVKGVWGGRMITPEPTII